MPQEVTTPRAQDIDCEGTNPLVSDLSCYLNGNRVTMELEMMKPIPEGTDMIIKIGTMKNPGSTYPTESFGLSVRSETWYEVAEILEPPGGEV